jgi:hypothetical protein
MDLGKVDEGYRAGCVVWSHKPFDDLRRVKAARGLELVSRINQSFQAPDITERSNWNIRELKPKVLINGIIGMW